MVRGSIPPIRTNINLMEKIENKWTLPSLTDEELKKISMDLYNGKIYTDRHCPKDIISVFMPLVFMGPKSPTPPKHPNDNIKIDDKRDNTLYDLLQRKSDEIKYKKDIILYEQEKKDYDKYLESIGLVYEYISEAGPMCINGHPIFMSIRFLNIEDTKKMFDYHDKYMEIRKQCDNF